MFAVIFEVNPRPDQRDTYLGYAHSLRPELERIDGFIDNERFSSLRREAWLLSLSIWRDEKAVIRWRTAARHHEIQHRGRTEVFRDYHLRVGEVIADSQLPGGQQLGRHRFDETQTAAKMVALSDGMLPDLPPQPDAAAVASRLGAPDLAGQPGLLAWDAFASIYQPGKFILLTSWRDAAAAAAWRQPSDPSIRHRRVGVIRDYGMFDRTEAPQYFPAVAPEQPARIV
jgi:heme-degrading monooxygenase HmoA